VDERISLAPCDDAARRREQQIGTCVVLGCNAGSVQAERAEIENSSDAEKRNRRGRRVRAERARERDRTEPARGGRESEQCSGGALLDRRKARRIEARKELHECPRHQGRGKHAVQFCEDVRRFVVLMVTPAGPRVENARHQQRCGITSRGDQGPED
jgi:hypothetical protein